MSMRTGHRDRGCDERDSFAVRGRSAPPPQSNPLACSQLSSDWLLERKKRSHEFALSVGFFFACNCVHSRVRFSTQLLSFRLTQFDQPRAVSC